MIHPLPAPRRVAIRSCLAVALLVLAIPAQDAPSHTARFVPDVAATPLRDAQALVSVEKLAAQVKPLRKDEVAVELTGWLDVLKAQAERIRDADIQVIEGQDAGAEAQAARGLRDQVARRVAVVIASLAAKGGDPAEAQAYVDAVAGLPPVTGVQAMWITARSWLTSADGGLALALNVGQFVVVLLAFRLLAVLVSRLLDRGLTRLRKTSDLLRSFVVNTTRKLIFFIGLVIALSYIGLNIGPFIAAIGAAGFVIGFALQGTLSNFAAGIMILIYRPYDIGDVVSAGGVTGSVDSMNLVSTTIKTPDNQSIVVPNSSIWGGVITNITANPTRRVDLTFGIGYGDDIGKAKAILTEVCAAHALVLAEPATVVQVGRLGDSSVDLICRPWAKTVDYWTVLWDLQHRVKERFDAEGITIPFPQRDVHVYQHAAS